MKSKVLSIFLCFMVMSANVLGDETNELELKARAGDSAAQFHLGLLNSEGDTANNEKALYWFLQAAKGGLKDAQFNAANMFRRGDGTAVDYASAIQLYKKSANLGFTRSMHSLGVMYDTGEGVAKNAGKAAYWYEMAALEKYVDSQINLAFIYDSNRLGVEKKYRAYVWLAIARNFRDDNRIESVRDSFYQKLGPEEKEKAGIELNTIMKKIQG